MRRRMNHRPRRATRWTVLVFLLVGMAACGGRPGASTSVPQGSAESVAPGATGPVSGTITVWTIAQGDDEVPIKAYEQAFEEDNPDADVQILVVPEDGYQARITTSLQAGNPPDVALLEPDLAATMKAGRWVDLQQHLDGWGVDIDDFNPGGLARGMIENDPSQGVYAIGDFVAGNVIAYNKQLFADAGQDVPPSDRSLTFQEYDQICRALGQPSDDPADALYGCSMPDFSFSFGPIFGEEGHQAVGYMNSPGVVGAFQTGAGLINDGYAPGSGLLDTIGESDLFAQGRIAMTWTDFTEIDKYRENDIDFGLAPFFVVEGQPDYVDVFTAAWGTFEEANNPAGGLAFIRFIATEAQRIRPTVTPDPPLSEKVAAEIEYGKDDPIKRQYLEVLELAPPPNFIPPGVDAWDPAEVLRLLTVEGRTDAQAILDEMAAKSQSELEEAWRRWESLGS